MLKNLLTVVLYSLRNLLMMRFIEQMVLEQNAMVQTSVLNM
jgi:hypothetical protein